MSKLGFAGVFINAKNFDEEILLRSIDAVRPGGKLDVVIKPLPSSMDQAKEITKRIYEYAPSRPSDLDLTVLYGQSSHSAQWEATFSNDSERNEVSDSSSSILRKYEVVAVGGTWDHMHWGHRLMLTLAAYTARSKVVIGVTSTELLVNKKYAAALDSYPKRVDEAKKFVSYLRPDVSVDVYPLQDMYGPTVTVREIEALVVSAETSAGGGQVNDKRKSMGWPVLDIIEVGLIQPKHGNGKLSSTDFRREHLEERERTRGSAGSATSSSL